MKSNLAKVSLALLSAVFILGCQDLGSGPVGPDGVVPQFAKKCPSPPCGKDDDGGGGGNQFVFVDVVLDGWMITDPLNQINQMELARKPGIMKIRANNEKAGTKFLHFAIDMTLTLAKSLENFDGNCEWSGRVTKTDDNIAWAIANILPLLVDVNVIERSVLVVIDESAFVETPAGTFVSVSEDNRMNVLPGFFVRGGSPTVTVLGHPAGDNFTATFSGGKVELAGSPPQERNEIHLSCNIMDDITFKVMSQSG